MTPLGVVVNALFCELENTHSYFLLMWGLDTELRHTDRTVCRPACRIQVHSALRSCRCLPPSSVARWTSLAYS